MDQQFLDFFEIAIKAQKQAVNEAWEVWQKKPFPETYENGFYEFLMEYLDEEVKKQYEKAGIAFPKPNIIE